MLSKELINNNQLNEQQLNELNQLSIICQSADGGLPNIYFNLLRQKRDVNSNILYYQHNKLIGFLSVYFFYEQACEVNLLVNPDYRRQGIARQLLTEILPFLDGLSITTLIFSTFPTPNCWFTAKGFTYQHSEYRMQRDSCHPIANFNTILMLRPAVLNDIASLSTIDEQCFPPQQLMHKRFSYLLADKNYSILLAQYHHQVIGKIHIRWYADSATFSDIAILPDYQGQGLGSELLALGINYCLNLNRTVINLDVEAANQSALNLYIKHGFAITAKHDYWYIAVNELKKML